MLCDFLSLGTVHVRLELFMWTAEGRVEELRYGTRQYSGSHVCTVLMVCEDMRMCPLSLSGLEWDLVTPLSLSLEQDLTGG